MPNAQAERKADLVALRERWAGCTNKHLEKHQHAVRVDHRSLKDQGAEYTPERHLGPVKARQVKPEQKQELKEHRHAAGMQMRVKHELGEVIQDVKLELKQLSEHLKQRAVEVSAMVKEGVSNAMEQFKAWQAEKLYQAQQQEKVQQQQKERERQRQDERAKTDKKQEREQDKKIDRGYNPGR